MQYPHLVCSLSLAFAGALAAQQPQWAQSRPTSSPTPRQNHAMAYDAARQQVVLFGAWDGTRRLNDTWTWDGTNWTLQNPAASPTPRDACAMAYDSARQRVILTGGYVSPSETWEWDGTNWTLATPITNHQVTTHPGMAYDSRRQRTVLFGTVGGAPQTWEYDGRTWLLQTPATSPSSRGAAAMAYDENRQRTVLFGGTGGGNQTWEWDGTNWAQVNTVTIPPSRFAHGVVYDAARRRIVMFGGAGAAQGDTWEFDGNDWTRVQTTTNPSAPRRYIAMAYDIVRRKSVLFGGRDFSTPTSTLVGDTWEYSAGPCTLGANTGSITIQTGGTQVLTVDGGTANGSKLYWVFGSMTGTSPGVRLGSVLVPLVPDAYTDIALGATNSANMVNFRGLLSVGGTGSASLVVPGSLPIPPGFKLYHAAAIYLNTIDCATNPVQVELK